MTLKKAIEVLNNFKRWRLGNEDIDIERFSVVTKALDTLLDFTDSPEFFAVESKVEIKHEDIIKQAQIYADRNGPCYQNEWIDKYNSFILGAIWYKNKLK